MINNDKAEKIRRINKKNLHLRKERERNETESKKSGLDIQMISLSIAPMFPIVTQVDIQK